MATHKQYKPQRTKGLGFVPPTLRLQHLVRLPFVRNSEVDRKIQVEREASNTEWAVENGEDAESPVMESQDMDSQSQGQSVMGA